MEASGGPSVGSSREDVLDAYADAVDDDNESAGEPLLVVDDDGRVLRFDLDDEGRVTSLHAGDREWAMLAEGCF